MKDSMRVAFYVRPGGIRFGTMPKPTIEPNEILVKVKACGISISDIRAYVKGWVRSLYHKLAGEISEIGEKVEGYSVGERVYFSLEYPCMKCRTCLKGHNNICESPTFYYSRDIALAEYIKLPSKLIEVGGVIKVPNGISFEDATHVGPLSNCVNTLEAVNVEAGDNVVIVGAGYMGLLHLQLLKIYPANAMIVSDVNEYRIKKAEELGADTINPQKVDFVQKIREITHGGADVVVVATANPMAMKQAFEIAREKGRINFFGGMRMEPIDSKMQIDASLIHYSELSVTGTYGSVLPDHYIKAVDLMASNRVSVAGLNTHKFNFNEIHDCLKLVDDSTGLRAIICLD